MNSLTDALSAAPVTAGHYPTDAGTLPLDTRKVMCKLLLGPFLDPDSQLWPALLRDEATVRQRLSDLFLDLIIDRDRKVAFTRQADTGDLDTPVLQRSHALTYLESVLLLHLRQALVEAENLDQRAVISEGEIRELLEVYAAKPGVSASKVDKSIRTAIDKMRKATVLRPLSGIEKRFEVSPTLRLLFSADDVEALGEVYRKLGAAGVDEGVAEDEDDE